MTELPAAEEMSYWKSGTSAPDTWLDKTEKLISEMGGEVTTRIVGRANGKEAILLVFRLQGDNYKLTWPVLPTKKEGDRLAATRQCATGIYHDTKARVNRLKIFGPRVAFADYLVLPSGKTVAETDVAGIPDQLKLLT